MKDNIEIRCPKCSWKPDGGEYWRCNCQHVWNTFDTGGRCPKCKHQHEETQCPDHVGGCSKLSPHLDWYHGLTEEVIRLLEESWKEQLMPIE
jgi:hypothetical protein